MRSHEKQGSLPNVLGAEARNRQGIYANGARGAGAGSAGMKRMFRQNVRAVSVVRQIARYSEAQFGVVKYTSSAVASKSHAAVIKDHRRSASLSARTAFVQPEMVVCLGT